MYLCTITRKDTQRELFSENPRLLGLDRQIGPKNVGHFGYFEPNYGTHLLIVSFLFGIFGWLFYKKKLDFISCLKHITLK